MEPQINVDLSWPPVQSCQSRGDGILGQTGDGANLQSMTDVSTMSLNRPLTQGQAGCNRLATESLRNETEHLTLASTQILDLFDGRRFGGFCIDQWIQRRGEDRFAFVNWLYRAAQILGKIYSSSGIHWRQGERRAGHTHDSRIP